MGIGGGSPQARTAMIWDSIKKLRSRPVGKTPDDILNNMSTAYNLR